MTLSADQPSRPRRIPPPALPPLTRRVRIAVVLLLTAYAVLSLAAAAHKGVSFDEGEEIAVGYNIWLRHDFRMEAANGDFIKRWATLPLLLSRPHFPGLDSPDWRHGEPYSLGFDFLFQSGNEPGRILRQARVMAALLGVATGLLVFFCSREIFGPAGGLISLGLFAFSPHMLAFGGIVSTEMSIGLGLLGSIWCIWHLLHRITWRRLLGSLGFVGLTVLAKPTVLVILPITACLIGLRMIAGHPLVVLLGPRRVLRSRWAQAAVFFALIALHAFAAWGAIWADYDFRYRASPNPADPGIAFSPQPYVDPISPLSVGIIRWSRRIRFLPQGYRHGIQWLLGQNDERQAFMDGRWKRGGWRFFFPYTMWAKGSPALLLLIPLAFLAWWRARCARRFHPPPGMGAPGHVPTFYSVTPFLTLIGVYGAIAVLQDVDIGHRHILPIYPAIYVLAGASVFIWSRRAFWAKACAVLALLWYGLDSCAAYPDYLAYFNPLLGGPEQGYRHLVDSSLDWGMDLPGLKRWLAWNDPQNQLPFFLAYFGTDSPEYYGIDYQCLLRVPDWWPHPVAKFAPGIYAISATLLQGIGTPVFGPWTAANEQNYRNSLAVQAAAGRLVGAEQDAPLHQVRPADQESFLRESAVVEALSFCRLCAWLRHHRAPDSNIGHSILIWKLDARDLHDALQGPPPELAAPLSS